MIFFFLLPDILAMYFQGFGRKNFPPNEDFVFGVFAILQVLG